MRIFLAISSPIGPHLLHEGLLLLSQLGQRRRFLLAELVLLGPAHAEVADEEIEAPVAVPVRHAGLDALAAARAVHLAARLVEDRRSRQLGRPGARRVEVQRDRAVAAPDDQIERAVPVPVRQRGAGVVLVDLAVARRELGGLAPRQLLGAALVGQEPDVAVDAAHDEVEIAVAIPVGGLHDRRVADVDLGPVLVLQLHGLGEGLVRAALEEVELARPAAGDDVTMPVAVEVHDLWTEADASPGRDGALGRPAVNTSKPSKAGALSVPTFL